jgi:predicted DNA-binding protein
MRRHNIHLSDQERERLQRLAKATGLTVAEHIRRAVDRYLEQEEKRAARKTQQTGK